MGFDSCSNAVIDILSEYKLRRAGGRALVSIVEDDKLGTLVTRTRQTSGRNSIYVQIEAMQDVYTLLQMYVLSMIFDGVLNVTFKLSVSSFTVIIKYVADIGTGTVVSPSVWTAFRREAMQAIEI